MEKRIHWQKRDPDQTIVRPESDRSDCRLTLLFFLITLNMPLRTKYCSKCNAPFSCGAGEPNSNCWCDALPHIGQIDDIHNCLCPACLKEEMKKKIDAFVADFKTGKQENIAPKYRDKKGRLVPDLDYYIEDGNWVFTEWHHLKRGDCCGSGCLHCPYEHNNVIDVPEVKREKSKPSAK